MRVTKKEVVSWLEAEEVNDRALLASESDNKIREWSLLLISAVPVVYINPSHEEHDKYF